MNGLGLGLGLLDVVDKTCLPVPVIHVITVSFLCGRTK